MMHIDNGVSCNVTNWYGCKKDMAQWCCGPGEES